MTRLAAALLSLISLPVLAADNEVIDTVQPERESVEAQACRPTIACMAEIVPAGYFEVEAGYYGRQSGSFANSGQLLLKYSLLDNLQLQVGTNNVFLAGAGLTPRAFDGVMPGLKWKINDQGTFMPSNAISVHLNMPTHGFADAAQKTWDFQAWWYVSKDIFRVHADFNLMVNVADLRGTPIPQGLATVAVSYDIGRGFGVFSEIYSAFGNAQATPLDGGSLNGFTWGAGRRGDLRHRRRHRLLPRHPGVLGLRGRDLRAQRPRPAAHRAQEHPEHRQRGGGQHALKLHEESPLETFGSAEVDLTAFLWALRYGSRRLQEGPTSFFGDPDELERTNSQGRGAGRRRDGERHRGAPRERGHPGDPARHRAPR
ncbi:MAG: hypothetical protein U0228_04325 [Myxococcaceae bacterium]